MAEAQNKTSFMLDLVSPEKVLTSEPVTFAIVPASEGPIGVLPGHSPLLTSMAPGVIEMHPVSGDVRRVFISGGFLDISPENCTVLAVNATDVSELDEAQVRSDYDALVETRGKIANDDPEAKRLDDQIMVQKAMIEAITGKIVA